MAMEYPTNNLYMRPDQIQNQSIWKQPQFQNPVLQPSGTVFIIPNPSEVNNLPIINGISVGICFEEKMVYIKSMQSGIPQILAYKLTPFEAVSNSVVENPITAIEQRLTELENTVKTLTQTKKQKGSDLEWQI